METNPKYRGRARAAFWSKTLLAIASVLSVLILPFGFDWESAVIVAGILVVTFFEFRVYSYFLNGDPRAPDLGFRNQSCFAAAIMAYGLYYAFQPVDIASQIPPELRPYVDEPVIELLKAFIKYGSLTVGIIGGMCQFAFAWYYRTAKGASASADENL